MPPEWPGDIPPMTSRFLIACAGSVVIAAPAFAVIERPSALKTVLDGADAIFVATVERLDPARPAAVFTVERELKGTAGVARLPVNLAGDKADQAAKLLERLAPGLPVVLFVTATEAGKKRVALAYTDGTWFQVIGRQDGPDVRWAFTHCEPYLRRTFKGSTAELEAIVAGVLAGKRTPPKLDPREPPGLGPAVKRPG